MKDEGSAERQAARLEHGPAYKAISNPLSPIPHPSSLISHPSSDWPMFRHDVRRSGATDAKVGAELAVAWQSSIGGRPSAPVVAGGRVFVASVDEHTMHALNSDDGRSLWAYTAGGRVESPPAVHEGLAIFGSADGRVVAVRAADGALAWRFRAAPADSRIMVRDQLESA